MKDKESLVHHSPCQSKGREHNNGERNQCYDSLSISATSAGSEITTHIGEHPVSRSMLSETIL